MSADALANLDFKALASLRHAFHRIPELGYAEFETAALIRNELTQLGIPFHADISGLPTATVAHLGDPSKPCIALRADIDALPIVERTGASYASTHPDRMHACGHDGHITVLLGAAAVLRDIVDRLPVSVKLIFQPAEEGGGGAGRLAEAGVLDGRIGPKAAAIFGLHGWPGLPLGMVSTKPGPVLAATDSFTVTFTGKGCHGAFPHLGRDPVVTACEAVLNLQQFVSREMDPTEPAVITVGQFNAGTATNIIPDTAVIAGTARTLTVAARDAIQAAIRRRCTGVAAANGCEAAVDWHVGYPPTINDPAMAAYVEQIAIHSFGAARYIPAARPAMGGEDFAFYLEKIPGCFFLIGVNPLDRGVSPPLHSDQFDFADGALETGVRMFVELVTQFDASA
ncbi:MAG TPA: M20 family metallopeptidase [Tepidisphaeraceae bacterium]|jgi:amidohydrolase